MRAWFLLLIGCAWFVRAATLLSAADAPDFDRQIAPLLAGRCLDCHSGSESKGGLDLSTLQGATKGGESGPAIVPRKFSESQLWQRVAAGDMPPKKPLPENERKLLQAWLEAGAKWGSDPIDPYRFSTGARAGYDWWSLQPVKSPAPSSTTDENAIDQLLLAKLREKQLSFSPPADRRILIRRLTYDLTGLPPTPAEIEAFVKDPSDSAYEELVQRLLASPHYGERWARHWLDVAHFGESDGFEFDKMRPNAWRYRDWVIDALNRDLPYDQFAKLQIAGDVLAPTDQQAVIATGFLVAGAHDSLLPAGDAMRQIMRQDELEDIVGLVGQTFLGLTVHCARCHDHKFDPIRAHDYYSLASALAGVRRGERALPAATVPPDLADKQKSLQKELQTLEAAVRAAILAERTIDNKAAVRAPEPTAEWEFDGDAKDSRGSLHGQLHGGAKIENGLLVLDGKSAYVSTPPLAKRIRAKTLEVLISLNGLKQRGGGAITLQKLDGSLFDSIVYGEKEPGHWLAGSNFFQRTTPFAGEVETAQENEFVHFAVVYEAEGQIRGYRNGRPYGSEYRSSNSAMFEAESSQVLIGLRHGPPGGNKHIAASIDRARLYSRALTAGEVAAAAGVASSYVSEDELMAQLTPNQQAQRRRLQEELAAITPKVDYHRDRKTFAITPAQPEISHLLVRGNPQQKGPEVRPAGILSLSPKAADFGLAANAPEAERRKKLAEWIASEQNPLFARTMVNRLWQYHFGQGLISTPNDLGFSGGQPSHPELLDYLASEFIQRKWSLKELHKLIVTSRAYQQASMPRSEAIKIDSNNRLLWRFSPRRLEAEAVRDSMLMVSGKLNSEAGGPSFKDFLPVARGGTQFYQPQDLEGPEYQRRSIYRMWARGGKNPLLDTFDCPDPSTTTPTRGSTTTPLQALSLLNHSFTLRMADAFAERLQRDAGKEIDAQVALAFSLTAGDAPTAEQKQASTQFVQKHGLAPFCRVLLNSNAFLYVD
ncbi:Planctomycete cytochrome C [Anatilimnocola aggregata]|uniref:Planctomycete cytochrome C n=1 Tax=Anatilimnocola aggregata TaxID=2528021 RepID=A0A517YBZ5_9BACT|nr:DUF1553 domain-containing protein [Anatilimnocola aggregata]QDU27773.1 Planctomycete cytochrome C [Anatilimnocola aggregata]